MVIEHNHSQISQCRTDCPHYLLHLYAEALLEAAENVYDELKKEQLPLSAARELCGLGQIIDKIRGKE